MRDMPPASAREAGAGAAAPAKVKPRLRGVFHLFGFIASLGGALFLALAPAQGGQYLAGVLYGAAMCTMFGLSSLYHRPMWSHRVRAVLRRVDHVGIFAQIGGTFTPVAMLHAGGRWDWWLTAMWAGCAGGALFMVAFSHANRALRAAVYVALGLLAAPVVLTMPGLIGAARVGWLFAGASIYIAGAVVYARRWPNPRPSVFGYHEVFHLLVIAAAAMHYAVVLELQYR